MKLSVSSYSFAQYTNQGKMTQTDVVAKAHELGIQGVDFTDLVGETYEEQIKTANIIREESEKYGIEIVAYTIGACLYKGSSDADAREVERLAKQLELAKIMGASVLRHDVCYNLGKEGNSRSFDLMLPTIVENIRKVADIAQKLGIKTCTENHGFISQDSYRVEKLFNKVAHDNFGLLVDIGNFACADEDSVSAVSRVAPYAVHVHAKDFKKRTFEQGSADGYFQTRACNYLSGCVIGEGDIGAAQCIQILKRAGYDSYVTIEYEGREDCIEGIKRGRDNLLKMM